MKRNKWKYSRLALCAAMLLASCRPTIDLPVTDTYTGYYYIESVYKVKKALENIEHKQ
jgi:hypothetical protein